MPIVHGIVQVFKQLYVLDRTLHVEMFDALNSIEPRYNPHEIRLAATPDTSKEAAAASAAAAVLIKLVPDATADVQAILTNYLATLPEGEAKSKGIQLGQTVAPKILEARDKDGASAADAYRPKTKPGVYIPTPITVGGNSRLRRRSPWPARRNSERSLRRRSRARNGPGITTRSKNLEQ